MVDPNNETLELLSDDELIGRLSTLLSDSRRVEADLVAHIAEVDRRELYLQQACPSMFVYCTQVLNLSEAESYFRITVARASRKFPRLLPMLAAGRLHLSGMALLAPHLTDKNCEGLLDRATHKTKKQIEEIVAELVPKPDVPATIRKLPTPALAPLVQLCPERVEPPSSSPLPAAAPQTPPPSPRLEPLAPERFKVTFTANAELREKLERLQSLTQQDLAAVIEAAVTEKLERLESKRYGRTENPRREIGDTDTSARSRYIPVAVKRLVCARDQNRCTFVDRRTGRRCPERHGLEFHHHDPYGLGGDHHPDRISLRCPAHNRYQAERDYGKTVMDRYRRKGDRVEEPTLIYGTLGDWHRRAGLSSPPPHAG
jgi:hypothetical protein